MTTEVGADPMISRVRSEDGSDLFGRRARGQAPLVTGPPEIEDA